MRPRNKQKGSEGFVVFRLPYETWETGPLNSSTLDDSIHEHTIEGKPWVSFFTTSSLGSAPLPTPR